MKPLSKITVALVKKYLLEGFSTRQISDRISGVSHMSVSRLRKTVENVENPPRTGRPKSLTQYEERKIVRELASGNVPSAVACAKSHNSVSRKVIHPECIRENQVKADRKRDNFDCCYVFVSHCMTMGYLLNLQSFASFCELLRRLCYSFFGTRLKSYIIWSIFPCFSI